MGTPSQAIRGLSPPSDECGRPSLKALAQLKEKGCADKHRHLGRPIHLIGLEFSQKDRNIAAFKVERAA